MLGARRLALVAVDGHGRNVALAEMLGQPVGAMLGTSEDQHLEPALGLDQMRQQVAFLLAIDPVDGLLDGFGGRVATCHLDQGRPVEQLVGQRLDLVGEGRREQQVLALGRQ